MSFCVCVTLHSPNSVVMVASFPNLFAAATPMKLNGKKVKGHVNTGSTESFICESLVEKLRLLTRSENNIVSLVSTSLGSQTSGYCLVNVEVERQKYFDNKLSFLIFVLLSFFGKILWGNSKVMCNIWLKEAPLSVFFYLKYLLNLLRIANR